MKAEPSVVLRRAGDDDLPAVAAVHIASWRATYGQELSADFLSRLRVDERVTLWRQRLAQGATLLVAEQPGVDGLLGFVASGPSRDVDEPPGVWEIWNLHLSPDRKGTGLGSRLFDAAVADGLARGATQLTLWVVGTNDRARRFYEHKGMAFDGTTKTVTLRSDAASDGLEERMYEVRYRRTIARSA